MAMYIYTEDLILEALERLSQSASTRDLQESLIESTKTFNKLSFDVQETWNDEYWELYETTRDPKKNMNETPAVTQQQISKKLLDLQEIAITLSRMSRGAHDNVQSSHEKNPFQMVDDEAQLYTVPSIKPRPKRRDCLKCEMF
jgi:hypothetical protein